MMLEQGDDLSASLWIPLLHLILPFLMHTIALTLFEAIKCRPSNSY